MDTRDDLESFAQQLITETKETIRREFQDFKKAAFPKETEDALQYEIVCLIEDEFRKQEEECVSVLSHSFTTFRVQNETWLERYKRVVIAYQRMAVSIAHSFLIYSKGQSVTYDVDPRSVPTHAIEKFFEKAEASRALFFNKHEASKNRLSNTFQKAIDELQREKKSATDIFSASLRNLLEVTLPTSQGIIRALINQHYLQRVAQIHKMN